MKSHIFTIDVNIWWSGHLDPQVFLDWLQSIDRYFILYALFEMEKVLFSITKLTGQASQYWADVKRNKKARFQTSIETWKDMKDEFMGKYVSPFCFANFLDK